MNFWDVHGLAFLIFVAIFPRFTLLFAVAGPFGLLTWLGWLIVPHVTVAVLATARYWDTNPILCVIAWVIAFGGTGCENRARKKIRKKSKLQAKEV